MLKEEYFQRLNEVQVLIFKSAVGGDGVYNDIT